MHILNILNEDTHPHTGTHIQKQTHIQEYTGIHTDTHICIINRIYILHILGYT